MSNLNMNTIDSDYHVHSTYSDGYYLPVMVQQAQKSGLKAVGIADHCIISDRKEIVDTRAIQGFSLDKTYQRRSKAIELLRPTVDIDIYDAVEIDYAPADEETIAGFLADTDFDYTIGSVHQVDGRNIQDESLFSSMSDVKCKSIVGEYVDRLESLIQFGLFDIAAHPDLFERNRHLRGYATTEDYERIGRAFARSNTIAEINAGRIDGNYGEFHPSPDFLTILQDYDIELTVGTDSHHPDSFSTRLPSLETILQRQNIVAESPLD